MKVIFAALLASVIAPAAFGAEITLEEKWRIVDEPTFSYEDLKFYMNFSVSEFIIANQSMATLYTDGCQEEGASLDGVTYLALEGNTKGIMTDIDALATRVTYDGDDSGPIPDDGSQKEIDFYSRKVGLQFGIDPEQIAVAGKTALALTAEQGGGFANPVYTEDTVGNVTAQVRFCVRFGLYTGESPDFSQDVEVNFIETIVTLDIDLSSGFQVDAIDVAPRDRLVRTAAQAYECEGYFCNADETKMSPTELAETRNQGAQLRVCVVPTEDARTDGVYMRRIDSFTWSRNDGATPITQDAVVNSLAATNGLTTLTCAAGDLICHFETILFAQFYATAGSVAGSGICSMQFGGNGCEILDGTSAATDEVFGGFKNCDDLQNQSRKLRANRYLQNEDAATAQFDLNLELNQGVAPIADNGSGAASTSVAMVVLGMAGAALML